MLKKEKQTKNIYGKICLLYHTLLNASFVLSHFIPMTAIYVRLCVFVFPYLLYT